MGVFGEILYEVLDNQGDFFTSGLGNAIRNYHETKHLFSILSCVIGVLCLVGMFIRAIFF